MATWFEEDSPKTIDLNEIKSDSNLADLKKKDPFMFYSIPFIQKTVVEGKSIKLPTIHKAIAVKESTVVKRLRQILDMGHSMIMTLTLMMLMNLDLSTITRILSILMHFSMHIRK